MSFIDGASIWTKPHSGGISGVFEPDTFIELTPAMWFPEYTPPKWYELTYPHMYYESLSKDFWQKMPEYVEGAQIGWYRTVRALYPDKINTTQVNRIYDRWRLGAARELSGQRGMGIKDGVKAAVDAFGARR